MNKLLITGVSIIIAALLGYSIWSSYKLSSYEEIIYNAKLKELNLLAEADSLRQINDNTFVKLSKQLTGKDKELQEAEKTLLGKNQKILALTKVNAKLETKIQDIVASFDSTKNAYLFKIDSTGIYIVGNVKVNKDIAIVNLDTLKVPVKLQVAFVKYVDNENIEVQIKSDNKYLSVTGMNSIFRVPTYQEKVPEVINWSYSIGGLWGKEDGVGVYGSIKYKRIEFLGLAKNSGFMLGVGYVFK
jgi:hypothetical protein